MDKKYTDYQIKIKVAENQAQNIQKKQSSNSERLTELWKNFEATSERLKQEKDKMKSLVFMNLKQELLT